MKMCLSMSSRDLYIYQIKTHKMFIGFTLSFIVVLSLLQTSVNI